MLIYKGRKWGGVITLWTLSEWYPREWRELKEIRVLTAKIRDMALKNPESGLYL